MRADVGIGPYNDLLDKSEFKRLNKLFCFSLCCDKIRKISKRGDFLERCIIFCAGGFDGLALPVEKDDYIIAADGGFAHLEKLGITPNAVLGDFDSLGYVPENANVFPVEKDDTDTMLAIRHGLGKGCREFLIYGALDGPRLDHTVANFQALQFLADRGATGYLIGLTQIATVIKNETVCFPTEAQGILSLFCTGADSKGVTLQGLKYPLEKGTLTSGFPLGVSNHFTGVPSKITVTDGSLLLLFDRQNLLPGRQKYEV